MAPPKAKPVDIKEIELPPEDIRKEMAADDDQATAAEKPKVDPAQKPDDIAELDFLEPLRLSKTVPLKHGFRLDGTDILKVSVRKLRTGEVAQLVGSAHAGGFSNFDAYELMTGLPAKVLRGMDYEDGEAITEVCFDFLPPILKGTEEAPAD